MAEIIASGSNSKRAHKIPRIDLTPMVDLGFLLITFFMYTTSLAKPKLMDIRMPVEGPLTAYVRESTITIIPAAAHRVLIYSGTSDSAENITWCGFEGKMPLREQITSAKKAAADLPATFSKDAHQLHVIIKPDAASAYSDLVRVLDEMLISDVRLYSVVKMDAGDHLLVQAYGK